MEIFDFIVANEISKVEELLDNGTDPNIDRSGNTPLIYAVWKGRTT
jgi:ankyrin repeat protein